MNTTTTNQLELSLGLKKDDEKKITQDQIQAAYALNLCAVSVSQIIDYNDINILDQEYESILNNLNLEHMPKDDALLDIIKRLLETITFFRIQEGDKEFIEKDYQQRMKNAIWNAMPNPGALIGAGLSGVKTGLKGGKTGLKGIKIGLVVSLAASVGTAYMNYRKNKAEIQREKEKQDWELKKSAIEQFQYLQQQLFETSWRLAGKYNFPDALRLSERQIKQYNLILMDNDEIRKFERLDSIKHKFTAYPPFWYYFGNTANSISISEHYGLDENEKKYYRNFAKMCFEYFTIVNKYDLLREDGITASCYLEYVDLLDDVKDKDKIKKLLEKAVESAGNTLDVLQLCAISYMKIGEAKEAAFILRQLVNEQYNEVTNAQLLSSIYVSNYIKNHSESDKYSYRLLESRICLDYLFPFPKSAINVDKDKLETEFIKVQRNILKTKYKLVLIDFIKKYEAKINRIIPIPEDLEYPVSDDLYADKISARTERVKQVQLVMHSGRKSDMYRSTVRNTSYSYEVLEILNEMFASICMLECVQDEHIQLELQTIIEEGIRSNRDNLQKADKNLIDFDEKIYADIQKITLRNLTSNFFVTMAKKIKDSVDIKTEMSDFAIAEYNLAEFCKKESIDDPEFLFAHKDDAEDDDVLNVYFTPELIGEDAIKQKDRIKKNINMISAIRNSIDNLVINVEEVEFYTQEDPRMNRYFYGKTYRKFRSKTLAVLDDRTKGDMDLLFTTEGLMPIIKGKTKAVIPYDKISWSKNSKKKELIIGVKYSNDNLDMDNLFALIGDLSSNESKREEFVL